MKESASARPVSAAVPGELQQLWLTLARGAWRSLAVVPTAPGLRALPVASALTDIALFYDTGTFKVIDASGIAFGDGSRLARELAGRTQAGERLVVAVDAPMLNAGALPLVMAVEAALLVVGLGETEVAVARSIIEIIGRDRILGSVAVAP